MGATTGKRPSGRAALSFDLGVVSLGTRGVVRPRHAPQWDLLDEAKRLERTYRFKNFAEAFAFVERAAALAETQGHHPDISFGWGYATVSLRTKKIKGLHENDFIMAAKLDRAAAEGTST